MNRYCICLDDGELHAIKLENNYYDAVIFAAVYSTRHKVTCIVIDLETKSSVYRCS